MRHSTLCILMALVALPVFSAEKDKDDFSPLFDGKTFDGWEGNLDVFRIEDGAIVGGSLQERVKHNDFLTTKKEYADFELRLKFKLLGNGANAGVQIRSRRVPKHHEMIGYQADLGNGCWGCLYDESRRRKFLAKVPKEERTKIVKKDDWNEYVVRCEGRRIQLWINGKQTVDYTEEDKKIEQKGLIGLQIHGGPPSEAWYKDIVIKELNASTTDSTGSPTAEVTGVVTFNGKPLEGVSVVFTPEHGRPSMGTTDASGKFTLSTFRKGDGALRGKHVISIAPMTEDAKPAFPKRYWDAEKSALGAEVRKGRNHFVIDIAD